MRSYKELERSAQAALFRLAKKLEDEDILLIPLSIVDEDICGFPIAATDLNGIMLTTTVVDKDPLNLEVYICHEIFHYVVHEQWHSHTYTADVLNFAADFKINQLTEELYGYNVRKVKFKGLRNLQFDSLSIDKIARILKSSKPPAHFQNSVKHPVIQRIANALRRKLGYAETRMPIKFDFTDTYYDVLRRHYPKFKFSNLPNIDPELVVKCLWVRFYENPVSWNHTVFGKHLTHSETLLATPTFNPPVLHEPEFSIFAAMAVVNVLNESDSLISKMIASIGKRILKLKYQCTANRSDILHYKKFHTRTGNTKASELEAKVIRTRALILRLRKRRAELAKLPSMVDLLMAKPSVAVRSFRQKIVSLSSKFQTTTEYPRFDRQHPLPKLISFLLKTVFKDLEELHDVYKRLADYSESFASESGEDEQGRGEPESDEDEQGRGEPESGEDEQGRGEPESGQAQQSMGNSGKAHRQEAKPHQGNGKGGNSVLSTLTTLNANPAIFKSILNHAIDFGDKLVAHTSHALSDNGLLDKTLAFGRDLSRLPSSELGRLGSAAAKLSFLVDLANGNLLQYSDLDPRRSPLILCLDCSGSMHGRAYEIAAGFCLSMLRKLSHAKRSCVLVKFSSGIDQVLIFDKGSDVTLSSVAKALLSPSMGGTDFDVVLGEAFDIHEMMRWSRSQVLLISDGGGTISDSTVARKPANCKTTGVLIGRSRLSNIDEVVTVTRKNLAIELVRVGNSIL